MASQRRKSKYVAFVGVVGAEKKIKYTALQMTNIKDRQTSHLIVNSQISQIINIICMLNRK
jgi:hypothetical protein